MKFTSFTKRALAARREQRKMKSEGFRIWETDWEIHRGFRTDEVIVEARISICGKYVYTKLGKRTKVES